MLGYEWLLAPFMQMERDFLRDIIFRPFLCLSCRDGRRGSSAGGGIHGCRKDALITTKAAPGLGDGRCGPRGWMRTLHQKSSYVLLLLEVTGPVLTMEYAPGRHDQLAQHRSTLSFDVQSE